jgi:hypothetical protein
MKEYVVRTVAGENVEAFLNAKAKEGYVLLNMQPVARKIRDEGQGTEEMVYSFVVTMERDAGIGLIPEKEKGVSQ